MVETKIFGVRTAANREDQVVDYLVSKLQRGVKNEFYGVIRPHGMRGYIFVEAASKDEAEAVLQNVPYARGILPHEIPYAEIEHMLDRKNTRLNSSQSSLSYD